MNSRDNASAGLQRGVVLLVLKSTAGFMNCYSGCGNTITTVNIWAEAKHLFSWIIVVARKSLYSFNPDMMYTAELQDSTGYLGTGLACTEANTRIFFKRIFNLPLGPEAQQESRQGEK